MSIVIVFVSAGVLAFPLSVSLNSMTQRSTKFNQSETVVFHELKQSLFHELKQDTFSETIIIVKTMKREFPINLTANVFLHLLIDVLTK